jgi:hypothetical protein
MQDRNLAKPLSALSEDGFGIVLGSGRAEVIAKALSDILPEIERLRSLDLSDVDPVVVFDPVNAARGETK